MGGHVASIQTAGPGVVPGLRCAGLGSAAAAGAPAVEALVAAAVADHDRAAFGAVTGRRPGSRSATFVAAERPTEAAGELARALPVAVGRRCRCRGRWRAVGRDDRQLFLRADAGRGRGRRGSGRRLGRQRPVLGVGGASGRRPPSDRPQAEPGSAAGGPSTDAVDSPRAAAETRPAPRRRSPTGRSAQGTPCRRPAGTASPATGRCSRRSTWRSGSPGCR